MQKGKIYLVPCPLGDDAPMESLPLLWIKTILELTDVVLAENEKHARAFIKKCGTEKKISEYTVVPLNEHTSRDEMESYFEFPLNGKNTAIISEAGCPAIADPGSEFVKLAHKKNIPVIPVSGPSSIFMALMASGLGGQQFTFHGYLPKEQNDRIKKIKEMERMSHQGYTQLFMDTPYRNNHVLDDLLKNCIPSTLLCIAASITCSDEFILTKTIDYWKTHKPDLHKKPVIFGLG
ncbi:MAG: SAM-dependent methyltransferase [Bacteroidota bacterium]